MDENVTPAMPETRCVKVDDLWTECLWAMPKLDEQNRHPFHFETIKSYQDLDPGVKNLPTTNANEFRTIQFGQVPLVCKVIDNSDRIVLTDVLLPKMVRWFHAVSSHTEGMDRLEASMRWHFWHPRLRDQIR